MYEKHLYRKYKNRTHHPRFSCQGLSRPVSGDLSSSWGWFRWDHLKVIYEMNYRMPFIYRCQNAHLYIARLYLKKMQCWWSRFLMQVAYTRYPSNNYTYEGHLQFPSLSSCPWSGQCWRRRCPWPGQPGRSGPCPWAGS